MQYLMKLKTLNIIIGAILIVLVFVVWKLNSYYKQEKSALTDNQIHQQTLSLKTSISTQLAQLKNVISSYQGQIDESKINWVQLHPFFALVQVDITNGYSIKNLLVKSGTPAENWSRDYIQKALSYSRFSNKDIHIQLFQNQAGEKFLVLVFSDEKIQNSRRAVVLVGEASYFQRYFDLQRSARGTNLLMTNEQVVVGHTQSDYIATKTQEDQLNPNKYFLDKDQIRSSNLAIISYAPKLASGEILFIPLFVLVFIFGFAFLLIGVLLYALKPLQDAHRKAEIFKKVFEEVQPKPVVVAPMATPEPAVMAAPNPVPVAAPVTARGVERLPLSEVVELALANVGSKIYVEKHFESTRTYDVDVERFRKAIENIINNSIEAQAKEVIIKIYDIPGVRGQVTNIDIIDDGQGIDPLEIDKIWQPFYGTKDKLQHKGLGLPEALSVIRRYGADIKVVENKIGGTTLRIEMEAENRFPSEVISKIEPRVEAAPSIVEKELDIDSILSLDDIVEDTQPIIDLEKELTTTQFKMDQRIEILEDPKIHFAKSDKPVDQLDVKIRRPGRT